VDPTNDRAASFIPAASQITLDLFAAISDRAADVVRTNTKWGESGRRDGQYVVDLDVDDVCVRPLRDAGFDVLSEESGLQTDGDDVGRQVVVVDPLDGSTNASLGLPWCATALCLVIDGVPTVAMVTNLATGDRYSAVKDRGANRNGQPILVGAPVGLDDAVIAVNGLPPTHWGWRQFRAMGAAALDIAAVARGGFDGYVDTTHDSHGVWDYLASVLILREAGGFAVDALGRDLTVIDHEARRTPVVASDRALLEVLLARGNAERA
jgi:fructose-1,6-bisphosphatase/inositol monophosphatase family enzyme